MSLLGALTIGGALAGGLGAAADFGNNIYQNYKNRQFNSAEAQKQRDFQKYMAQNAHQMEVEDLKAAGLNPVLSATGGAGASAGSGSSAHSQASGNTNLAGIASILSSAASLANNKNIDRQTTEQVYNSAGDLIETVEKWTRDL